MVSAMHEDDRLVPLVWVGLDDVPIHMANLFLCQVVARDHFVLTIGQGIPPPLLGTPEEIEEQIAAVTHVPVKPLARLALTEETLEQVSRIIQENLGNYRKAQAQEQGGGQP